MLRMMGRLQYHYHCHNCLKDIATTIYNQTLTSIYNQYTQRVDQYPPKLSSAYNTVRELKKKQIAENKNVTTAEELSFLQDGNLLPGRYGQTTHLNVKCYGCKNKSYSKSQCPEATTNKVTIEEGTNALKIDKNYF